jgi:3-oxoacyl-[acyl-carrier protein] reductase
METLHGRVAIVTGGAAGIGRGIGTILGREGAGIFIGDINQAEGVKTAEVMQRSGIDARAIEVDVADRASVDAMAVTVLDARGRIDVVAANAGIYPSASIEEMADADWDAVMDVNVKGVLHTIQACVPSMRAQQYGRIVITSSVTGPLVVPKPPGTHYAASKSALLGLMRSAALELVGDGITVNAVLPGNVHTPGVDQLGDDWRRAMIASIPAGRLAEPEDVGWAVRFLASVEAGYITGQTLVIDGGQVLPEAKS